MKKCLFLLCVLFANTYCFTQQLNKDSLLQLLSATREDTSKVKLYLILSDQYLKDNLDEAEKYAKLGGGLSKKINYQKGIYNYYSSYQDVLMRKGKFDSVLLVGREALSMARNNAESAEIGRTMLNMGIAYKLLEDFDNAIVYIEEARDILIKSGEHRWDGKAYNLLQLVYYSMHQYRKGIDNGIQAVKIYTKQNNKEDLQYAYNNLALNYIMTKQYDSARFYLNKARIIAQEMGEMVIQITVNLNFALIGLRQQQLDSLKIYALKALAVSRHFNANEFIGLSQYGLAYYYLLKKDYQNCKLLADSSLALAQRNHLRDVKQKIYPVLSGLYYGMQDSKKGYYYFSLYETLRDSILNESITKNTIQTEKKFQTERKENQIKVQEAQLRQKTYLNYILTGAGIVLLVVSFLGYRNYRNKQILQQAKIDELETEKKLTATEAILKGEEQERTRLAKDLHDGLGGMLSGIKHSLNTVKGNLMMTPDNAQAFERSIDMLDSSIKEIRRVAHNMMPEILVRYGLDSALNEFCNEITRSGVIYITYQSIGMKEKAIDQTTAVAIYRIVQELVTNAVKHASAKNILVQVHASHTDRVIALTVEDDGKGFDKTILNEARGMGWSNIRSRVEFLKGKIDVHSEKDKGTSVLIEINDAG